MAEQEKICECGHEEYSHNWNSKSGKFICIGENPYWSGCNCKKFKLKENR